MMHQKRKEWLTKTKTKYQTFENGIFAISPFCVSTFYETMPELRGGLPPIFIDPSLIYVRMDETGEWVSKSISIHLAAS